MPIIICPPDQCTGCYACSNVCPKQSVSLIPFGPLGYVIPNVNENECIECGLCKEVCQVNHPVKLVNPLKAYAGWHKSEDEYLSSTSGGAATAIAQLVIKLGGVVYGCACVDGLKVNHIRVSTTENLYLLKGSKYVQSDVSDTYSLAKKDLLCNKKVLFIGTPCQIAGLKSFLRKEYENLYTIDIICHGTPSQELLTKHVGTLSKGEGYTVQFRKGNDYGLRVFDKDRNMIYYSNLWYQRYKDVYYNTFIDGYTYRPSCYNCNYACGKRCSDITVGDFWGLGDDIEFDSVNGCSCILPITKKGLELVRASDLYLYARTIDEAVRGNDQLRHPMHKNFRRKLFDILLPFIGIRLSYYLCEIDNICQNKILNRVWRKLQKVRK